MVRGLLAGACARRCVKEPKFFGYTSRITLEGEDVRLLVPTTFMNLSGKAVGAMASFTVFSRTKFWSLDELDLPSGRREI